MGWLDGLQKDLALGRERILGLGFTGLGLGFRGLGFRGLGSKMYWDLIFEGLRGLRGSYRRFQWLLGGGSSFFPSGDFSWLQGL